MRSPVDAVLAAPKDKRRELFQALSPEKRIELAELLAARRDDPWAKYAHDPVRFVTNGLREQVWSKQAEILESVRDHRRTAVPACHAPGKSHIAARAIAWWVAVHRADTVRVVTTATTFRQVRGILWPHIRRVVLEHGLPGEVLTTEWKVNGMTVADGFSPADHNESAVQGIHAENLLIVVDEAGGISDTIGKALESLTTGNETRILLLGNPPTDRVGSWFERACNGGLYNVIPIPATATPAWTGEKTGPWRSNLVDQRWVEDVTRAFGENSSFVQARVHARFPTSVATTVIPFEWVDAAQHTDPRTGMVRLGVDVAADGGDELAVARLDGNVVEIVHTSRDNKTVVDVCGVILACIRDAEALHAQRGITEQVAVKVDAIGLGWGVAGLLEEWGKDGRHAARIVAVNVAQQAIEKDRFVNQRAEMWWEGRTALEPEARLLLNVDQRTAQQLALPTFKANASGRLQVEAKNDLRRRSGASPDRAEAVLLALFSPMEPRLEIAPPIGLAGSNQWR